MKRIRRSPEQIVRNLREADAELAAGETVAEVCRGLGVSETTYHRWRNRHGSLKADEMKRLKDSEEKDARLKACPIVEESTRECQAIEAERSLAGEAGGSTLEYLFEVWGVPDHIRSDNGPEFIAEAVKGWPGRRGTGTLAHRAGETVGELPARRSTAG